MHRRKAQRGLGFLGLLLVAAGSAGSAAESSIDGIRQQIESGEWRLAAEAIEQQLARPGLSFREREDLRFQQDRMRRIRLDFSKTREEVLREARQILPGLEQAQFDRWEHDGAVEYLEVNGVRHYLDRAAGNLFRVHPEARALKQALRPTIDPVPAYRRADIRRILRSTKETNDALKLARTFRVRYTLSVKPGTVPAGEIIRAWLPFPQDGGRQTNVRLLASEPSAHLLSGLGRSLSCVYLEQPSQAPAPTVFEVVFEYRHAGFCVSAEERQTRLAVADPAPEIHLGERPPHIVFDAPLRALSREIVGPETDPHAVARRIFQWVAERIPWAGAREYSTLESLTAYALRHRRGDCGIQTMLFMALCRLNGIPARWESGWTTGPDWNLHDWCSIYLEPHGWIPVDVSYGLVPSNDARERWFYLGGIDSYRLILNTDFGQELYPLKNHFRSEFVDFQRGEVEWRGGNLYFDEWTYQFEVEEIPTVTAKADR